MSEHQGPKLKDLVALGVPLTPMMTQYYDIKKEYPNTLLLFRMGDFYEMFFEDAHEAASLLNIVVTHRGKLGTYPIPMAGIPHHAAATYIDRITARGKKAVICEQVEDPKEAKGIVKRAVTQIVSPGMPFDLEKTSATERRYMAAAFRDTSDQRFHLVLVDYTTGDFRGVSVNDEESLVEEIRIAHPREWIAYLGQWDEYHAMKQLLDHSDMLQTHLSADLFDDRHSSIYIEKLIPHFRRDRVVAKHAGILKPIGALAYYMLSTQSLESLVHIRPFQFENRNEKLIVSHPTLVGLELLPRDRDHYRESLLGFMDRTQTAMGTREWRTLFLSPLRTKKDILERQAIIRRYLEAPDELQSLRRSLSTIRDIERIMAKIGPRKALAHDLLALAHALEQGRALLHDTNTSLSSRDWKALTDIATRIRDTLNDELGASLDKGNLIRNGVNKERDKLARLTTNANDELLALEQKYRKKTGIGNLKIKFNNINGHTIEVSKSHSSKVPKDFERRQTLVNGERYVTKELIDFEKDLLSAKDRLFRTEKHMFDELIDSVSEMSSLILVAARALAYLDVMTSMAWVAHQEDFRCPDILDEAKHIELNGVWHPLIKQALRDRFVPHTLHLDETHFFGLVTGPNMAGKTTVLRETAIVQFLAQLGSFVPASSAKVGLCDYLFGRLGAGDDIIRGQSTFMVEMTEMCEILRHATDHSLILLDEVGRGTSTYDGLSIAWAIMEHILRDTQALTLFSTHYHELIDVADRHPHAKNFTVEISEKNGDIEFLYRLIEKGAAQSFGIHVAKLAGLPSAILFRAQELLREFEAQQYHRHEENQQLSFFEPPLESDLVKRIQELDILNMTPLQAMSELHELKQRILK